MSDSPRHDTHNVLQGLYDELSGLPGPALFFDRVQQSMHLAEREMLSLAVVVIQLYMRGEDAERSAEDQAKIVASIAQQLAEDTRVSDTVGLLGTDQLGILLPNVAPHALPAILQRIIEREPLEVETQFGHHEIPVRMGMALRKKDCVDVQELMSDVWDRLDKSLAEAPIDAAGGQTSDAA